MAAYVLRFDDVCPRMRADSFSRIKLLERLQVRPLLSVVPNNQDPHLNWESEEISNFWQEIRRLQGRGWAIGLHGYQHKALGFEPKSEFVGLDYPAQLNRLKSAKAILTEHGIQMDCFVAPYHSYDTSTLKALLHLGIDRVSDGLGLFPYYKEGMLFVPQLTEKPRRFPLGIFTFCLHPNFMKDKDFTALESFILANRSRILSFQEAARHVNTSVWNPLVGKTIHCALSVKRRLGRVKNNETHYILSRSTST